MADQINAFPLAWPAGWKRMSYGRKSGSFGKKTSSGFKRLNPGDSAMRVLEELGKLGVERHDIVISTNLKLRMDGLPKDESVMDPGVAVYWLTKKGQRRSMAIDAYHSVADNLAAIAATLEALRAIERHGGAEILDRAFTGFTALPSVEQWWQVLGVKQDASRGEIQEAYRKLATEHHPDRGGGDAAMARINVARDDGLDRATK
ncbi:MAG TPA: J domain-containing protein [Steroidobacteraceae bacterium]|jgi:hypothetical protein